MPPKRPKKNNDAASETARPAARRPGAVTLADVARMAGVSPITVSRALHRPELVTDETRAHVQAIVDRTGYSPNMLAGGLASKRSRLVAAIVPSITNGIFVDTVQALTDSLWHAGYQVLLGLSGYPATREDALLAAVLSRRPDAIYLTGINHSNATRQRLLAANIPIVETWDLTPTPIDMLVGFSHEKVGQEVARHLYAKGYRRIGMVWADDERARVRRKGFVGELMRLGVSDVETASVAAPSTLALGRRGLSELLTRRIRGKPVDAVFCGSDLLAHGALEEARARGIEVPKQLAIIGFGGLEFTEHTAPALSTVLIDRSAIGRIAAEVILMRMAGTPRPERLIDIGFSIADRGTT